MEAPTMSEPVALNLGCGDDIRPHYTNVDYRDAPGVDEVVDLDETPWPWDDSSVERILASHVFEHLNDIEAVLRECARILTEDGQLDVRMPMGLNAVADPDHERRWTWRTPTCYCGGRPWDVDVGLSVVEREVDLSVALPGRLAGIYDEALRRFKAMHGPGMWCFGLPATTGEFSVRFQKPREGGRDC